MRRKKSTRQKRRFVDVQKAFFSHLKLHSDYVRWFAQSTEHLFWLVYFFLCIFDVHYAYKKHFLGSTESLGLNWSIIRQVEIIIRHEKAIFVRFKEIISWQIQDSISAVKKSFFKLRLGFFFGAQNFFYAFSMHVMHMKNNPQGPRNLRV